MYRRDFLKTTGLWLLVPSSLVRAQEESTTREAIPELRKSKDEWRELLDEDAYYVLFEEGTERAFTSPLNDEKRKGTYICAACLLPLFESDVKFDSGTGWPSFIQPIPGRTATKRDFKLIFPRTEYHCIPMRRAPGSHLQRWTAAYRRTMV